MRVKLALESTQRTGARARLLAYTLAEVAVTSALAGILFVALYGGMSSGFALTQASRENLRATQILLERMEGVRLFDWNELVYSNWIPSTFTEFYYPTNDPLTRPGESPGIKYTGTMQISNSPALSPATTYGENMCLVRATVNWVSAGVPRTRTMTTLVAKSGVQNYVYNSTNQLWDSFNYVFP